MLVLKVITGLMAIAALIYSVRKVNAHCERRFGYEFFTIPAFALIFLSVGSLCLGVNWYHSALANHGDVLNGLIVSGLGGLLALGLAVWNVRRTNAVYGVGGSVVQFGILGVLAVLAWPVLLLGMAICVLSVLGGEGVFVTNK